MEKLGLECLISLAIGREIKTQTRKLEGGALLRGRAIDMPGISCLCISDLLIDSARSTMDIGANAETEADTSNGHQLPV
jgi:hypothetical protein